MHQAATLYGSHGQLTFHVATGHIISASDCRCDDCKQCGSYRTIAFVDVADIDPNILDVGEGDILGAGLVYRSGKHFTPCIWIDGEGHYDALRLPPPAHDPIDWPPFAYWEVNLCALKQCENGDLTALEEPDDVPAFYSVYVMPRDAEGDIAGDPVSDADFTTIEEAQAEFARCLALYPDAEENVYSMPRHLLHLEG